MNKDYDEFVKDIKYQSDKEGFYYEYIFKDDLDFLKNRKSLDIIYQFKSIFDEIVKTKHKINVKIKLFCKIKEFNNIHIGEFHIFDDTINDTSSFFQHLENLLNCEYSNYDKFEIMKLVVEYKVVMPSFLCF